MTALTPAGSTRRWRQLRRLVLIRDSYRCRVLTAGGAECGAFATHVDHITPRVHGGTDSVENLRAACAACNLSRGAGRPPTRPVPRSAPTRWSW